MPRVTIGDQIRRLRQRRGLSQPALAQLAGLSRIYIAKIEAGERTSPSFPTLERVARALRVRLVVDLR
jgi:transcriptional regulator with XRE-family HTH domain